MREKILAYSIKYDGQWNRIAKAIAENEEIEKCSCVYPYITIVDKEYPTKLKSLRFPPWILFYIGDISLLNQNGIGIVGSREISDYGRWCTQRIVETIKNQKVIISGMAKGIDAQAHYAAINARTIGVLGNGLNVVYPKENRELYELMKKKQLLISEYPPDVSVKKYHFPWRNRIIAALSDKIVVPQARIKSGTMVTVNHAIEMGKEVYCVPYRIIDQEGEGNNELIENGAIILNHFDDLL